MKKPEEDMMAQLKQKTEEQERKRQAEEEKKRQVLPWPPCDTLVMFHNNGKFCDKSMRIYHSICFFSNAREWTVIKGTSTAISEAESLTERSQTRCLYVPNSMVFHEKKGY